MQEGKVKSFIILVGTRKITKQRFRAQQQSFLLRCSCSSCHTSKGTTSCDGPKRDKLVLPCLGSDAM